MDRALQQGDPAITTARARAPREREGWLALPLALFFLFFFLAPLALLAGISVRLTPQLEGWGVEQYAKFAGDTFNWSVLGQTLLLGVKTVIVTATRRMPIACGSRSASCSASASRTRSVCSGWAEGSSPGYC